MITAVVYAESGGAYKTTYTANLGVAFSRMGLDVLVVDLDPQAACLSALFEVDHRKDDSEVDNLVRHLLEMPEGDFSDLIESAEGIDILPCHDMYSDFTSKLEQKIAYETGMKNIDRDEYPRYQLMYDLFWEQEKLQNQYDVILIDPNARAEDLLYNALYAMRTLVSPIEPSGKGSLSIDGLGKMVENMQRELDIEIGLACVIPTNVGANNSSEVYKNQIVESDEYPTSVTIGKRESLMKAMWDVNGSAFEVVEGRWQIEKGGADSESSVEQGSRRVRDREVETLKKLYEIADFIATDAFGVQVDPTLELDIDGRETQTYNVSEGEPMEETA